MKRKIAIVTGTRAEYGLLKPLIKAINNNVDFELQLIACAMHLSPEFGKTIKEIEKDGFYVNKKIECLLSSDSAVGISKSIGLANISFADAFDDLKSDLIILLGDRTEILAAATTALIFGIPIAHIHGGENTEGAYDEAIRHAITKMSHLHFASTDVHKQRIIQLGEQPAMVFNVGAIGLDSIKKLKLLSKVDFEQSIKRKLQKQNILITYHPVTQEKATASHQFEQILRALDKLDDTLLIFTHANSDRDGRIINEMICQYVQANSNKACEFKSLGQLLYLSALQYVDVVVGNSSSGIIEVPYFKKPTINIGDRQKGRVKSDSIIDVDNKEREIQKALEMSFSRDFKEKCLLVKQLYGNGDTTEQILSVISSTTEINLKKPFFDFPLDKKL
ncbi:UDP-N-acetylglucosamine 2-epimerase [Flavobacterium tibetense]|uniref:UDP-N-acetylglucosamine 2-epimerase (Hydrolyzing) n=1 Tax=Flavobacterium tibetense TaxID=2233533 RepID=A0A365P3Z5_9FLAO|nr:UDP-N-acetylglucosamine 2-epimerase [Flavobacterium tibetense]RBA29129.1 UDP-N-acetylglucosamine 2-epimerase (hydrolyzing) [Flavobacterium tibetense]